MSPSRPTLRRGVVIVAVTVVVLLAAGELGARALAPYLPPPALWADEATQVKVAQMDHRPTSCTDLVVAGNSMGRDAFEPAAFQREDPEHRTAYNASLDAASPALLRRWVADEVVPRLHPATVVLPLASLDVNANARAGQSATAAYDEAPLSRAGVAGRAEAAVIGSSALLQHRTELRQPSVVWDAVERARQGQAASPPDAGGVIGPDGEGLSRRSLHYTGSPASQAFLTGQLLNDYAIDGRLFDDERALVSDLRSRGIDVVLVVLPVTDDYRRLHPGGSGQFDAFLDGARQLATAEQVPLLDLHAGHDRGEFADTHHLNGTGADAFTASLPALLERNGVPARHC